MNTEEIKQKVGEAFLYREAICISFHDGREPRWCIVKAVNSRECDIQFNTVLDDGFFVTALANISYKEILRVSF